MKRIDTISDAEQLRMAEHRVRELEHELQVMQSKLNQLTTSRSWMFIDWLRRAKYWLFHAPARLRREKTRQLLVRGLRKTGLYPIAARAWRLIRPAKYPRPVVAEVPLVDEDSRGYDVICLPVISWSSRFQRPQQMARQLAALGHRVFYASLEFHRGADAVLSVCERNIREMALPGAPGASVYRDLPSDRDLQRMVAAIDKMRREWRITSAAVVVQLPFWTALAELLRDKFGWPIVYDCMDDHAGFSTNCPEMLQVEQRTIAAADLVAVTSEALEMKVRPKAKRLALIRNACDFEHFAGCLTENENLDKNIHSHDNSNSRGLTAPGESISNSHAVRELLTPGYRASGNGESNAKPPTIGFYGAIAEWFDADLVADLAVLQPAWRFELIGGTFTGDVSRLEKLPNVRLLGEKPYAELPRLVADWDAFIIPFKRIPLTEATNPVKAYEMLATGKPVVAVDLPELRPMARDGLLALADDARGFAAAIQREMDDDDQRRRHDRRAFAAKNTWRDRAATLDRHIRELFPLASIIIVTYNNLRLNQSCLESVFQRTDWPNVEVIVVDNASTDGTAEWLAELEKKEQAARERADAERPGSVFPRGAWEQEQAAREQEEFLAGRPRLRVMLNRENLGFAGANNQALRAARDGFICLLNNDTVVSRGWLSTLCGHLRKMPAGGMVGPVSNMVGNEAKIPVGYANIDDMPAWAAHYCRLHDGESFPIIMLGFFCVAFPRELYERIGELDERFGLGYFEDTDYCYRAKQAGYEMRCVRDAFVHHWQGASFRLLGNDAFHGIFQENQNRFESKWGADSMAGAY